MPEFNKNLDPVLLNKPDSLPNIDNPSSGSPNKYAPLGTGAGKGVSPIDSFFGKGPIVSPMLPTISSQRLYETRRYSTFDENLVNIENQKAYAQSNWDKAANGVLKGLNLAATTIAGTGAMLAGTAKSIFTGRLADIWDNEGTRALDEWNQKVDNEYLPNYYTDVEKNAEWYSTSNWFKTNFLFDKLIKNSGFAVGAMVTGNIANAGFLRAGAAIGRGASSLAASAEASQAFKLFTPILRNTSRAFSVGKNVEAAAALEGGISSIADLTTKSSKIAQIAKQTNMFAKINDVGRRAAISLYSSAGEASFEALQTGNEYRNKLIEEYKSKNNGEEPTGEELKRINTEADRVGAASFFGNIGILTITEYAQLPYLLGSTYSSSKRAANSLLGKTDDVLLKEGKYAAKTPATKFGKIYDRTKGVSKYVFDPKEAAQEGLQYALQVGTQNYFKKSSESNDANIWTDGFLYGLFGKNELGEGVGTFVSKEGMEGMLLGGITGGLMQAKGNYQEQKSLKSNTQRFIDSLNNAPTFKDSFKERLAAANRGIVLQEQQQDAVIQGDKLEAKDLDADLMHNYLAPRIKYGRFDMVVDDIKELIQEGSTEEGLATLKQQGYANINDTVDSYRSRLSNFERVAKNTNEIFKSLDLRYSGELDENGNRKYSSQVIDKMVYAASKIADYDVRIPEVSTLPLSKGINLQDIIDSELSDDSSTALASVLNDLDKNGDPISTPEIKQSIKDVVEMSLRRKQFLNEYRDMINNPEKYDESGERKIFNEEGKKFRTTAPEEPGKGGPNYAAQSRNPFKGDKRTYDDLVKQYGEGEQNKYEVLKKITESPYATTMEKELAAQFMKYTDRNAKIILGDRTLPNPGVSVTDLSSPTASVSRINFEYNADDYEGVTIPVEFILLHEIGHDLTVYALSDTSDPFYNELKPLFDFVQEHFKKDENKYADNGLIRNGEFYAFKNIKEFATEALSNRDFQRYLNTIPYKNTQRSVWESFVNNLKTFFKRLFKIDNDTALDEAVGIITNNIDRVYKSQYQQNKKLTEEEEIQKREAQKLKKNKDQIEKEQKETETKSGTIATGDPTKESWDEESALKDADWLFTSGTTESEDWNDPTLSSPHVKRSRQFLNKAKTFANRNKLRAILVTPKQVKALGLEGIIQLSYKKDLTSNVNEIEGVNDVDNGFVAQVFVIQESDGLYFVDENGNKISKVGEQVDLDKVVFQTMPTTSLINSRGVARHRSDQKEQAEQMSKAWALKRAELFAAPENSYSTYEFVISRGIAEQNETKDGIKEKNHVGTILINSNEKEAEKVIASQQGIVVIPTEDKIPHNGRLINVPKGRPVLQYGDTLEFLSNKKFSKSQAKTIFEVMKAIADEVAQQSKDGKPIQFNKAYREFLQNVLFWVKGSNTVGNQIFIDESSINLGGKAYSLIDFSKNEDVIIDQLLNTYNNVNNKSLTEYFSEPFVEYYFEDGEIKDREWKNYQSYLLSSKTPDGKPRNINETPLSTAIKQPSAEVPYTHKQKYAILVGMELPISQTKPSSSSSSTKPTTPETPSPRKIGDYVEGEENVFTLKQPLGDTPFTFTIDENNFVSVIVKNSPIIDEISKDAAKAKPYLDVLKTAGQFDATKETKQLVLDFISLRIASALQSKLDEQIKAQTAPTTAATFTPTTPYGTPTGAPLTTATETSPVSTDAKADIIERRRQEKILDAVSPIISADKIVKNIDKGIEATSTNQYGETDYRTTYPYQHILINNISYFYDTKNKAFYPTRVSSSTDSNLESIEAYEKAKILPQELKSLNKTLRLDPLSSRKDAKGNLIINNTGIFEGFIKSTGISSNKNPYDVITNDERFKDIVQKVDAELAALEGAKPAEEQTKKDPNKFDGFDGPSGDFRAVASGEKGGMTEEELELFKQWHSENVPNIPFEVLENIIKTHDGGKAWGVFENGVAKFVKGGLKGTEYHEVFEGIWKAFLTENQRQELLSEFKSKKGQFLDRESGKKIDYADATDKQAKERIADDFSDFRLGKLPAKSLGEKIKRFFKSILEFFKSFVTKPSMKDKLFKDINKGKFKEFTVSESVKNEAAEYKAVEGLTQQQTHEFVQDMTARAAGILFKEANKKALFSPERITSKQMFSEIENMYSNEKNPQGFSKRDMLSDRAWQQLQKRTKEQLRTLGVNFSEDGKLDINDENYDNRLYAAEAFSTDWKKSSPFAIKFTLATLLKTVATNQSGNLRLELPKAETNQIGYKLLNFSRAFATLLDKMSNTTSVTKAVDKLINLADSNSDYVRLFNRLGGKTTKEGQSYIPFNNFDKYDWRLFINFMQVFTKQKPDAIIQYNSGNEVYSRSADVFTAAKETERRWIENMKALSKEKESIIRREDKIYKINSSSVKRIPISKPEEALSFLSEIGIYLSMDDYLRMKNRDKFMKSVAKIHSYLGTNEEIASITGATLGIGGPLAEIADMYVKATNPNQENTHFNVEGKRTQNYAENNAASLFENVFNESSTLDELLERMPQLKDVFSENSQVLKKGGLFFDEDGKRIKTIKVKHIEGTKIVDKNKGMTSAKLNLGDRFVQEINQNLQGNYYILIPADSSTEWMMEMGNTISFADVDSGRAWSKIYKAFNGYLLDDINIALDWKNRSKLDNVKPRAKELRFFKDILNYEDLKNINELIENDATQDEINEYLKENADSINQSIKEYIESTVEQTSSILKENRKILFTEKGFKFPGLDDTFALTRSVGIDKNNMSEKDVQSVLTFANVNYIINNIEYHKVLFGDPFQFAIKEKDGKVILDETKRIKSFLSPRRTTFDHPDFNNFLNTDYNKAGEIDLQSGDPGYHNHKSYTNTVTFEDVNIAGSLANVIPAYGKVNEADAMSWLMDGTYREIKLKNGQWSDEAEAWHQWQMAFTRQNLPGYKYTNSALEKQDRELVSKPAPKHTIEILKPIVSGVKYGKSTIDTVLDKFSQMPIYYSMVKGSNLEKLYVQMMNQGVGYAIVESGRKVGSEGKHSLYNPDGSFNETIFNNNVQVPWSAYGVQVETSYEGEKQQTRGSQLTKLSSMDLFDNGEASEEARKEYARNKNILDKMHQNAYTELLEKLGIDDLGNEFVLRQGGHKTVSEVIMNEMLRRELSDNAKDTVQLDENDQFRIPFEASPSYVQIRNILYSMVNKSISSPKMSGGAHVQVTSTMFESATKGRSLVEKTKDGWKKITRQEYEKLSDERKKNVVLADDTLKFYTKEDPYCEILLPHWFGEKLMKSGKFKTDEDLLTYLNTKEGQKILTGIGFRIPTQAMSSVEVFRVKGFLPQYMGATVVVPSEITAKAGSDFDIDKLNMYLKSVYIDENGKLSLIEYKGSEEATKEFYAGVYERTISNKISRIEKFDEFRDRLLNIADKLESYEGEEVSPKSVLTEEEYDFYEFHLDLISEINDQAEELDLDTSDYIRSQIENLTKVKESLNKEMLNSEMKANFVKRMYKKSLENEYYDSLEKMITLPENFRRLISPVDDAGLKGISEELDTLRGYNESNIKNRILNRNYMTSLRHAFVVAKKWVGIAAVNITGHSLAQKTKIYIDPAKFEQLSKKDKNLIGNGNIVLPHNKVTIDGREYISLSGRMDADGKFYISDGLSGYATTFVDVAKDPYIMKIITSDLAVGTFMFLQRVGVPLKTSAMFMNQPIIKKYLEMLDSEGKRNLFDNKTIDAVKMLFGDTTTDLLSETSIKTENLEANIKKYYSGKELTQPENAEQQNILNEFLKYAKMAEFNFKFTQATNYDTSSFRNAESLFKKELLTDTAVETNIISSVDDVLNNSFLGDQKKLLGLSSNAIGAILTLDKFAFRVITNDVLRRFAKKEFFSQDDYDRVANKIKASFLDFVIQTKTGLNKEVEALLVNASTSVAAKLEQAKKDFPNNQLLKDLQITSSPRIDSAKTVKLAVNLKEAYDENLYTGYMRELRDNPATRDLYYDIVMVSIFQGTYQSAISIRNIIPIEDFSETVAPVIQSLVSDPTIEEFSKNGWFERNNWNDEDVMPTVTPSFFFPINKSTREIEDSPISIDQYGNEIFKYISPSYVDIKGLNVLGKDRKILLLGEKFNFMDVKNEFVKVPRIIQRKDGSYVDVMTGRTITQATIKKMRDKGSLSFKDYLGYKKVRDAYGNPVIASVDKQGNETYVYKLINLYGDGMYASEYYSDLKPSPLNNGTLKIEQEIPDADIVAYYGENVPAEQIAASQPTVPIVTESGMTSPVPGVENITNSGLTVEESNNFIDILQPQIIKQAYIENKARTANMMFSFGLRWAKNIPNESEKSEQAKNLGKPRPNRKQIKSKEGVTYGYYLTDQNNNPLPSIKELQPIMDFIESKLGIDMSNYDAMLGNIYDDNSFIHQHRDTTESITAEKYPVIVINLGADGHLEYDKDVKSTYASYQKSGQLNLTNGGIYAFGVNGESRFTFHHRIGSGLESKNPLKPIMLPNGQVLNNYRITLTFRRASDLEPGMPEAPSRSTQPSTSVEIVSRYTDADVKANPNKIYVFGDNTQRTGTGGQAQIRNNSNAMGIATKLAPSMNDSAFMTDKDLAKNKAVIDGDIAKIKATGKTVVFPKDGLGTGLAKLKEKAPQTYAYLKQRLLQEFGFDNDMGVISQQPTSVEDVQVPLEVRYKDAAKRIRIDYPSKISQGSLYNDLNSNELIQLSRIEHSGNIAEQTEIDQDYGEVIAKKYGEPAGDYVGETNSEITIEEAEFLRDHPQFAKDFIEGFLNSELGDGKTLQEYAQALLDQNETLIDTAQGRLFTGFDTTNEFTDAQKNKILTNFGAKHKMNVEKAREYINQAMAEEPQKTINKLKECYL